MVKVLFNTPLPTPPLNKIYYRTIDNEIMPFDEYETNPSKYLGANIINHSYNQELKCFEIVCSSTIVSFYDMIFFNVDGKISQISFPDSIQCCYFNSNNQINYLNLNTSNLKEFIGFDLTMSFNGVMKSFLQRINKKENGFMYYKDILMGFIGDTLDDTFSVKEGTRFICQDVINPTINCTRTKLITLPSTVRCIDENSCIATTEYGRFDVSDCKNIKCCALNLGTVLPGVITKEEQGLNVFELGDCFVTVTGTVGDGVTSLPVITNAKYYSLFSLYSFSNINNSVTSIQLSHNALELYGNAISMPSVSNVNITIPKSVTYIGTQEFGDNATLNFLSATPPISSYFNGVTKIIVPKGCKAVYDAAPGFCCYTDIIEEAS